jgi:hypothetical protein
VQASDNPPFPLLFSADKAALINEEPKAITGPDVAHMKNAHRVGSLQTRPSVIDTDGNTTHAPSVSFPSPGISCPYADADHSVRGHEECKRLWTSIMNVKLPLVSILRVSQRKTRLVVDALKNGMLVPALSTIRPSWESLIC